MTTDTEKQQPGSPESSYFYCVVKLVSIVFSIQSVHGF